MRSLLFGFLLLVAWRSTWGQDAPKQADKEKKRVTVVLVGATVSHHMPCKGTSVRII